MSVLPCLKDVVGLSKTTCNCFDTNKPANASDSPSGLFVDDPSLSLKELDGAVEDCSEHLWSWLIDARAQAEQQTQDAIMQGVTFRNDVQQRWKPCSSQIGEPSLALAEPIVKDFCGLRIKPANVKGLVMRITELDLMFGDSGNTTVAVYSSDDDFATALFTSPLIGTIAGSKVTHVLATPWVLPLHSDTYDTEFEYRIVANKGFLKPLQNRLTCGCGGNEECHRDFMILDGINQDDFTAPYEGYNFAGGLSLKSQITCNYEDVICDGDLDFATDPIAMSMAYAIIYKSRELLMYWIAQSSNFNSHTLLSSLEAVFGQLKHNERKFNEYISVIVNEIDPQKSNCLACGQNGVSKQTIFA